MAPERVFEITLASGLVRKVWQDDLVEWDQEEI
jgi:hypothetical protein